MAKCTPGHERQCQFAKSEHCDCDCEGTNHGLEIKLQKLQEGEKDASSNSDDQRPE